MRSQQLLWWSNIVPLLLLSNLIGMHARGSSCSCNCCHNNHENMTIPDEHRLMLFLLNNYETAVRPVKNSAMAVQAKMGITLTQIFDMDEKNQVLVTNVWLDQQWYDEYLTWDPNDFGGIKNLRLPSEKIWVPDIVLYNNAADFGDKKMPALAMIKPDGEVFWPVPAKLRSTCKIDVTYFPFDTQLCNLKFGSWTYDGFQVNLTKLKEFVDLKSYTENGEWELENSTVYRNNVVYSCCPEPYPDVTFFVYLKRRVLYYMYHVIYPCIMMSTLTLLVFCLPPDSGEKIALGITVLLAFSVLMLSIAEKLPETSESVPIISIYLTVVMSMTSVSVIMTVFVLNLHHRGPSKRPVPAWLRRLALPNCNGANSIMRPRSSTLAGRTNSISNGFSTAEVIRNLSLKLSLDQYAHPMLHQPLMSHRNQNHFHSHSFQQQQQQHPMQHRNPSLDIRFADEESLDIDNDDFDDSILRPAMQMRSGESSGAAQEHSDVDKQYESSVIQANTEILHTLKKIVEKHELEDAEARLIGEWRCVAQFVDKALFWIYLFSTLTSTILILVIAPVFRIIPNRHQMDITAFLNITD